MKNLKLDFIFAPIMAVIGILLALLKVTGMAAHIAISVVGVAALVAYTVLTKKNWKLPALEIAMRAAYGVALITGIVIKVASDISVFAIVHKVFAALFLVALVVLFVHKIIVSKKA